MERIFIDMESHENIHKIDEDKEDEPDYCDS